MSEKKSYLVHNISWDTDGEVIETLPRSMVINLDAKLSRNEIEAEISEALSDKTGFPQKEFRYAVATNFKAPEREDQDMSYPGL